MDAPPGDRSERENRDAEADDRSDPRVAIRGHLGSVLESGDVLHAVEARLETSAQGVDVLPSALSASRRPCPRPGLPRTALWRSRLTMVAPRKPSDGRSCRDQALV